MHHTPHKKKFKTVKSVGKILFVMHFSLWIPRTQSKSEWRSLLHSTVAHEEGTLRKNPGLFIPGAFLTRMSCLYYIELGSYISADHWGSALKDNISDVIMRWKMSCASGCKHRPLISSPWGLNSLCIIRTNVSGILAIMWSNIELLCYSLCSGHPICHNK
jgi:hypothetical protein